MDSTDSTVPAWAKEPNKPTYTKTEVGLGNVDNTSDTNKPVSTAQATAIADAKKAGTDAQSNLTTHINNKSNPHGVTKAQVGLSNVDNVKQYSASNPPPYPVTSVNGKTGAVTLDAATDVVRYNAQTLADAQKAQARANIGAQAELTDADKESIVQQVITALGTPVFGRVDADNNIILTGELADGTYVLKYEDAEGNLTEIGTLEHSQTPSDPDDPDISDGYTNLADTTSADWLNGQRLNGSGGLTKESVSYTTNYIPVKEGDVVRVRGLNIWFYGSGTGYATTNFYDEGKTRIGKITPWEQKSYFGATKQEPETDFVYTVANGATMVSGDTSQIRYIRFSGRLVNGYTADDVIITVNQEITDESVEPDVPVEPDEPAYVNLADPTSSDWLTGQRLSSSGEVKTEAVAYTTNYIPLKVGDVVRIRGLNIYFYNSTSGYSTVHFYNESKARVGKITPYNSIAHFGHTTAQSANPPTDVVYTVGNGSVEMSSGDTSGIRYARFSGRLIDGYTVDDIIITVNQEITE